MALLRGSLFCAPCSSSNGAAPASSRASGPAVAPLSCRAFVHVGAASSSAGCCRPSLALTSRSPTAVAVSSQKRDEQEVATITTDLATESGASLEALRDKLAAGEWEAADAETRRLLCVLAGPDAVKRKWVYFSEVKFIPTPDLTKVDSLWRHYSNNKYGYSVQKKVWNNSGKVWNVFFRKVGWTRPLDEYQDTYRKFPLEFTWDGGDASPEGHLPLTNALRGTRLLEEVLNHPAFDAVDAESKLRKQPVTSLFGTSRLDKTKFFLVGAGLFSGVSALLYPVSVIKTRIQVARADTVHTTAPALFKHILRRLGYGGEKEKELPSSTEVVLVQALGGVIAGASSAIATTPMDTVKTRLQVLVNEGDGRPTIKQTVQKLVKEEGWRGFYKGFGPRFFSMSLWGTSMITTYEFLKRLSVKDE